MGSAEIRMDEKGAAARADGNPFSIICLSPQDWRVQLPTNRQQIMRRAADRGHEVLFVETGYFLGRHIWDLVRGRDRRSLVQRIVSAEQVAPRVSARKALNVLPWLVRYHLPNAVNCAVTARHLRRLAARLPKPVVLWIYDPSSARMTGSCGEVFAVYDCVDDYVQQAVSPKVKQLVISCDRTAAERARLVFTTSTTMYERQRQVNARTHLVPNVGDYEHFVHAAEGSYAAPEVAGLSPPVLGFAGNFLISKVDFMLLEELALARPQWNLLLIGPAESDAASALERLTRLPNIRWVGPKPYAVLPRYVAAFDVGLIPYVSNAYTRSCFPLKTYEYLAAGKPVVASGLPELAGMKPDVLLADDPASFTNAVEAVLGRLGAQDRARRTELASRNTWETRAERLLTLIQRELAA